MNGGGALKAILEENTMPAASALVEQQDDGRVRCLACANRCLIADGACGICRVRVNQGGQLRVPGGYVAGLQVDPIEKKPFYHVYPGRDALSFGMLGCNFNCAFCQNWVSSQVLRDVESMGVPHKTDAAHIVDVALQNGAPVIVSTYNEPLITADWSAQVFEAAVEKGLVCGFVSNGHATPEVIRFLKPVMRLFKVDLKCFDPSQYRELGGKMEAVLSSIEMLVAEGFWVEVVTLVVPGFNDSQAQLEGMAKFIAGVSVDIPWHVTAFHPDYRMTQPRATNVTDLERAYATGKEAGLHYVYAGNLPGAVNDSEHTRCHACGALLVARHGFHVLENRMHGEACPDCGNAVPGVWEAEPPRSTSQRHLFRINR